MREIKFRQYVWDNDSKEAGRMVGWDELLSEEGESLAATFTTEFSNASPLMQYTGLKDKDGQEVYEGDIVKILVEFYAFDGMTKDFRVITGAIEWSHLGFDVRVDTHDGKPVYDSVVQEMNMGCHFISDEWEVIGNIYDNPELLEVGNHA